MNKKGTILLELLLALTIGSVILGAIFAILGLNQQASLASLRRHQAELLSQEGIEVVRSLVESWDSLKENGSFYPEVSGADWLLQTGEEDLGELGEYKRRIEIEDVFRDASGSIVSEGGTLDPSTKKITSIVSWDYPRFTDISQTIFISRFQGNATWQEDTFDDFIDGVEDATDVTSDPGYVQLAHTGGGGEWTEPTIVNSVDASSKTCGIAGNDNYLYVALGASDKKEIEVFDISADPETPFSLNIITTEDNVINVALNGNYLYAALGGATHGLEIFDLSSDPVNPPSLGVVSNSNDPSGLWVQDGYLFASVVNEDLVDVYDLSEPTLPDWKGEFETEENTVDVTGSGNYIFVAHNSKSKAIEVFDISSSVTDPVSVAIISSFYRPTGIWIEGNTLYAALKQKRASMYDLSLNPTSPQLLGIFRTEQNTADITAVGDYGYVTGSDSHLRAVMVIYIGDSKGTEGDYFVYGEYISSTFDALAEVAFNHISWEGNEPSAFTNILLQIASNNDDLTWNFVGPDGTAASYFEEPGGISLTHVLGRHFKYKIILTGDGNVTPVVDKVTVNYSP